jgi:hypothetical protein
MELTRESGSRQMNKSEEGCQESLQQQFRITLLIERMMGIETTGKMTPSDTTGSGSSTLLSGCPATTPDVQTLGWFADG